MPIDNDEAMINVTHNGQNGDLPDPVYFESSDADIRQMVTEAVQHGSVPGIDADAGADFTDFVVDRFTARDDLPNRLVVRPKTPFGV